MRLTLVKLVMQKARDPMLNEKLPRGHIYRGKNRLVKKVDVKGLAELRMRYQREERNMLLLRHPYLTLEQSFGHTRALNKREELFAKWHLIKMSNFPKDVTLEDRLMHLKVKEAWE